MMDDAFQPCRPARPGRQNIVTEPLGENPSATMRDLTDEPPRSHSKPYLSARAGQIRHLSGVSAMNSARRRPAQGALGRAGFRPDGQNNRVRWITYALDRQPTRRKGWNSKAGSHGADSPIGEPQSRQL